MQVVLQQYTRLGPLHFFQMPKASLAPTLVGPLVGWLVPQWVSHTFSVPEVYPANTHLLSFAS